MLTVSSNLDELNFRLTLSKVRELSKNDRDAVRLACQTNLRFLLNCILRPPKPKKFPTLLEKVHGKIIDALPKCDPNLDIEDWDTRDEFIVMASRGMLKSTIGMGFLTQVILCSPDVRILVMSGIISKAESILANARKPFYSNEVLRYLFPEWAIDDSHLKVGEFTCPARDPELDLRDPTMSVASFESVKAGGHYELVVLDDATNEINSSTIDNVEKTHGTYDDTDELLEPGGFRILFCTKWHEEDLPEYVRQKGEQENEKSNRVAVSYFVLPAWVLRTDGTPREVESRNFREKTGTLTPEDVILTWPEKLNAQFLFKKYHKNRPDFYKQYLLDASLEQTNSFSPEILQRQFQSRSQLDQIPIHDRAVVVHWDLASVFTGRRRKSESDYSCGITVVWQKSTGRMYVVDAVLEHFNSGDSVGNGIIKMYKTATLFGPIVGHSMEDAAGARNLNDTINRMAKEAKIKDFKCVNWIAPENSPNAKNVRIAILASAMKNGSVAIISNIPYGDDIKSQFEKWSINAKRRKDDGPDCVAQIWIHYKGLIRPDAILTMQPNGPVLDWAPENFPLEEPNPHADEFANADVEWLERFTVKY